MEGHFPIFRGHPSHIPDTLGACGASILSVPRPKEVIIHKEHSSTLQCTSKLARNPIFWCHSADCSAQRVASMRLCPEESLPPLAILLSFFDSKLKQISSVKFNLNTAPKCSFLRSNNKKKFWGHPSMYPTSLGASTNLTRLICPLRLLLIIEVWLRV